ncbi:MAG TPA: SMI1/KNR4 family protein [Candidatus Binatia bacterium]|jgi:hypothetical protein|nr:SMI1/KNR4 family protein [Candidatus Binatia bacterium]
MFDGFKRELTAHRDGGYHLLGGALEQIDVNAWFQEHSLTPPVSYVNFLCQVGPGSFFGGALTIYPLRSPHSTSVESELLRLKEETTESIFPFGYDGTTELCYCFETQAGGDTVHWFSWEEKVKRSLFASFQEWIEAKPRELFKDQIYAGYKKLTNIDALIAVMEERAAFKVRLVNFDKQLQRSPDRPDDRLRRYNKLVLEVTKTRPVTIQVLTVIVARVGSQLGATNVEYATFPVHDIPVNHPTIRECYVFDPFNVPFNEIAVKFNPVIDLGSKMRVKFKELSSLLG